MINREVYSRYIFLVIMLVLMPVALAQGAPIPTNYYGRIVSNGVDVPTGTFVFMQNSTSNVSTDGWTDSTNYTLYNSTYPTANQRYFLHLQYKDLPDYPYGAIDGQNITVYVAGISATTFIANDSLTNVELNLTVTDTVAPSAPTSITTTETSVSNESTINVSWTASSDNLWTNLSYLVYMKTSTGVTNADTLIGQIYHDGSGTTSVVTNLPARGTAYYFTVYANDSSGNLGTLGTQDSVTVTSLVPAQVTGAAVTGANASLNVSWTAVSTHANGTAIGSDLAGYHVYNNASGTWTLVSTTSNTFYYNNSLTNDLVYSYKIAAYDTDGNEGQNSSVISGTPSEAPSINLISPLTYAFIQSGVWINFSVSSGVGLSRVWYAINSESNSTLADPYDIDTTTIGATAATLTSSNAENYTFYDDSVANNKTFIVYVNGELVQFNFTPSSIALSADNVSAQINAMFTGLAAGGSGSVVLTANTTGATSNVTLGTGSANTILGFTNGQNDMGTDGEWLNGQSYTVRIYANDTAGEMSSAAYVIVIDNIKPSVFDARFDDSDNITKSTSTLTFSVNVTDQNTMSLVSFGVTGTEVNMTNSSLVYTASTTPAALGCSEGSCTVIFVATDYALNVNNTHNFTFTVDDSNPTVSDETASDLIVNSNQNIFVNATMSDTNGLATYVVHASGTSYALSNIVGNTYGRWINATALGCSEGTCSLNFTATDYAGNVNSTTTTITVDNTNASINSISLTNYYVQNATNVTITVNITDTNGIATVVAEGVSLTNTSADIWAGYVILLDDADDDIDLVVTDNADNVVTDTSTTYTIDDTAPTIGSVTLSDAYVNNATNVTVTVNATDSAIRNVTAEGTSLTRSGDLWTGTIALLSGTSPVNVVAYDNASNQATDNTRTFATDDINPSVNLVTLSDSYAYPGQIVEVTVNVTDGYTTTVTANGNAMTNLTTVDMWAYNLTLAQTSGVVTILATDGAGNTNTTNDTGYIVDSTVPTFSFTVPVQGGVYTNLGGNITFNFTVSDQNLTKFNVTLDNGVRKNGGSTNGTNLMTFAGLQAGAHNAVFTASDAAGWNATPYYINFTMSRPLNVTKYRQDLTTELGGSVLNLNITQNNTDLNNNDTANINVTLTLEIGLNLSGTNASARIPSFSGSNANWEKKFKVETNKTSTKGNKVSSKSGANVQKIVLFANATKFLAKENFGMAVITFKQALNYMDVLYIDDDDGNIVYKLDVCSPRPSSVATASAACYMNTSFNVTLYLPHFSGGALANDTAAPYINLTNPVNGSTIANSFIDLNFTAYEANPNTITYCNYTLEQAGATLRSDADVDTSEMSSIGTAHTYGARMNNISNGNYNVSVICNDVKNQSSTAKYGFTVADSTNPLIVASQPTSDSLSTTSTSLSVTLGATTNEFTLCKYGTTNVSYASLTTALGSSTVYGTTHTVSINHITSGSSTYYMVCQDAVGRNSTSTKETYSVTVTADDDDDTTSSSTSDDTTTTIVPVTDKISKTISWLDVKKNQKIRFSPNSKLIPVSDVVFTAANDIALVTIKLSSLSVKPDLVEDVPNVYKYLELNSYSLSTDDISGIVEIDFKVPKTWVDSNAQSKDNVYLLRYVDGSWVKLETENVDYDGTNYLYKAYTPGFSYFAIAADAKVAEIVPDVEPTKEPEPVAKPKPKPTPIQLLPEQKSFNWVMLIVGVILGIAALLLYNHPGRKNKISLSKNVDNKVKEDAEKKVDETKASSSKPIVQKLDDNKKESSKTSETKVDSKKSKKEKQKAEEKVTESKIQNTHEIKEVKKYIKDARNEQYNDDEIKSNLLEAGWELNLVDNLLKTKK